MSSLIKQVFFISLSFSESLESKCDEPCMVRPILIELNPVELKYYPFMVSLDECSGSSNVLSPKIYVPKEAKEINGKVFNMITIKNEVKTNGKTYFMW